MWGTLKAAGASVVPRDLPRDVLKAGGNERGNKRGNKSSQGML